MLVVAYLGLLGMTCEYCFMMWLFPNRATHTPKMADTNQQSPPPQLGPVVSWLFDPHIYIFLLFSAGKVHPTDSTCRITHHKELCSPYICKMCLWMEIYKIKESNMWCDIRFFKIIKPVVWIEPHHCSTFLNVVQVFFLQPITPDGLRAQFKLYSIHSGC